MDTRAQAGVGGGVMGSSILKKYPISLFSVLNMVTILLNFALNRVRIEVSAASTAPTKLPLNLPPPPREVSALQTHLCFLIKPPDFCMYIYRIKWREISNEKKRSHEKVPALYL